MPESIKGLGDKIKAAIDALWNVLNRLVKAMTVFVPDKDEDAE